MDGGTAVAERRSKRDDTVTKGTASAPRPFHIERLLSGLHEGVIRRLVSHYRTAYFMSYSRGSTGSVSRQPIWESDPTGDVTADKEWARNTVAYAGQKLQEAIEAFGQADAALARLTEQEGRYRKIDNTIHGDEVPDMEKAKKEHRRLVGRKAPKA